MRAEIIDSKGAAVIDRRYNPILSQLRSLSASRARGTAEAQLIVDRSERNLREPECRVPYVTYGVDRRK